MDEMISEQVDFSRDLAARMTADERGIPRDGIRHLTWKMALTGTMGIMLAGAFCSAAEIVTIAGTGVKGTGPDGSIAAETPIGEPYGLEIGPDGALYVCEIANHLIRRVDLKTGTMSVIVGNGKKGWSGAGGPAREASLNEPYEVRFDSRGNLLFVDMKNAVVCRVDATTQVLTTVAGTGEPGFSGDGGPATQAQLNQPHSIALDADDNIYICDIRNMRVRKVDARTGLISTFAGGGNEPPSHKSPLTSLALKGPRALDYDGQGTFALALREGNALYQIDVAQGTLTHLAGTGKSGYAGDGQNAKLALLSGPKGVALTTTGDLYFTDTESHTIRVYRPKTMIVETVVGDGKRGDGRDGDPLHCRLARPHGICVGRDGNVYIGDSENHRVRVLRTADH
jgi:DNA-binding beta-propeller fold protein YncE